MAEYIAIWLVLLPVTHTSSTFKPFNLGQYPYLPSADYSVPSAEFNCCCIRKISCESFLPF